GATAGSGSGNTVSNNFNVGVTTINWTAKDGANNTITGTTTVTISAIPTATITVTTQDSLCLNTVLTASGGTSFQWVNGGSTVSTGQTLSLPLANCSGTLPFAPTSAARNFNVFVSGAVTATAGDTHGPVAMGGDLYLSGQTIFTMNTTGSYPTGSMNDANNYGMVIGGSVKYSLGNQSMINQGYLRIGNSTGSQIWYTDNNNAATNLKLTATGAGFNGNPSLMLQRPQATGTATQTHGLDFAGAFNTFTTESNRISNWSSTNASFLNKINIASGPNPHVMLVDNKINYIDLTVAQLNNLFNQGSIIFDNTPNANRTLVINVLASGTINWLPANFGGLSESDAAYIIWNFNGNCILNVNGSNPIYGTLLAPGAAVTKNNNNNFNGQIVAQALRVGSGEIHYYPFTSNLGYPGCSNTFQLYVTNSAGCSSSVSASYTYVAPLNTEKYTIVGLDAVTLADNNYVQSGGVGVNNNGGTATVQGSSSINGNGTFLKAPVLSVASTANVPTRYTTRANYVLPAMQYYTGTYTTGTYTVNQNQTVTLSANYGDLYISRGANVTLTGSTFKSVTIEETAKVTFTAATINLQKLIVGNNVLSGSAIANFNSGASVRISSQMTVGMKSIVNQANNRVYFYLGNDAIADKVIVKGGGAVVNGVVLAPTGNIKVGTDAQNPTVMNATATNCTQTNGCVPVTYNGWTKNYDGTYTFKYTVSNSCKNGISFYAFELKNGSSALSWSSGGGYTWEIENGTNNPYRSIKFQHPSPTMSQNSPSDVLYYTVSASDFNAMPTIRVTVHYGNNPTVQYTFNRDGCGTTIMPPPCTNTTMTGLFIGKTVTGDKCTYWNTMCGNNVQSRIAPAYVYQQPASSPPQPL
ncbi:MAG: choice-of-anchor A family protein, partial [Chitinophagaceae bacterium]